MGDILLMLLGGVHKVTPEDIRLSGDINVCVVGGMGGVNSSDSPTPNCGEKVHVSSLALIKMLKHGLAGVPMEVMVLMLGRFVDN